MSMFKKCKVVMLSTNEKANIVLKKNKELILLPTGHIGTNLTKLTQPQHLYITSDDEIENGDWCYFKGIVNNDYIFKAENIYNNNGLIHTGTGYHKLKDCCKIIATTNILPDYKASIEVDLFLPQLSQSSIQKYVEEYNKGNVITDVLVEYEKNEMLHSFTKMEINSLYGNSSIEKAKKQLEELYKLGKTLKLKISKDNTITIKKVKDSWSKEEHIEGMWEAYKASNTTFEDEDALKQEFNNWIKNLKL